VSTRTYLSIGDVLSLLRQEFPDITISKIRFLESQGLVDPERSPSGYRKFYEHDVERLRWVLRQQREHFLPLKVIRDRLAANGGSPAGLDALEGDEPAMETAAAAASSSETVAHEVEARLTPAPPTPAPPAPERATAPTVAGPSPDPARGEVARQPVGLDSSSWGSSERALPPEVAERELRAATPSPMAPRPNPVRASSLRPEEPAVSQPSAPPTGANPVSGAHRSGPPVSAGASLTRDELCAASGLAATEVAALEGFGLLEPLVVGGTCYYDEEALKIARLVADFARFGLEPRHLRLFRNAVDRELGLIEQVVTPMLRRRNPEARQQALDAASELSHLGQALRAAMLGRALRHHLGA